MLNAAFGTDPIPWHCLRIFFMRDTEGILYERYRFSSEDILYERYRFSSEGIRYLVVLVGPYVGNATKRSRAQCVCVSLRFVATGTYLHTVGDAENISKKVPSDTQGCSCPKYTAKYIHGVSQLFTNTNCQVASYQLILRMVAFEMNGCSATIMIFWLTMMTGHQPIQICTELGPGLERQTARSHALPVPIQVLTTLGFLATG
ncbi:hypothetical protein N1851_007651 [Merluccius polli]|uniref:Uncharacterized protein n=1 Tax=Merluccius polli TaxID=89951 RepID=A0AA47P573_MERPO|nr:hypothetical protein N1851_007651 [Merluccius polli]